MHLLQINIVANWGSTGHIAEDIGAAFLEEGGQSTIAYGRGHPESRSGLLRIGSERDRYTHALISRIFDNAGLLSTNATRKLIIQFERRRPDIIHLHNFHGYFLNYEVLFAWLKQSHIPIVWTLHDCWPFTGHCPFFSYANCYKWREACHNCHRLRTYPKSLVFDGSRRNYRRKKASFSGLPDVTLVAVSNWMASMIQQSFLGSYPVKVIYNGIDTQTFSPQPSETDAATRQRIGLRTPYMLMAVCADWDKHAEKGLDDLLKLADMLPPDYTLVLVGLTKEQISKIPPHVIAIGRVEGRLEMARLYSAADVVLNLSYEESLGMTTIEGLSCGTPSVVYNCTASPELVDSATGFVFDRGDIAGICSSIAHVCSEANNMRTACRERALRLFDRRDMVRSYMDLYAGLSHPRQV